MNICARKGCEEEYVRKTHNQKYCSDECCRLATNRRIMEKYYEGRARRQGQTRFCNDCNITKLSRYNDTLVCSSCKAKQEVSANAAVVAMLTRASIVA